jgi:hypothetical protein
LAPHGNANPKEDAVIKCDVCDEEFDTEVALDKHKAEMHAAEPMQGSPADEDLEEPDYKVASGE